VVWDFRHLQAALKSQFTSTIRQPLKDIGFKRWDFNKKRADSQLGVRPEFVAVNYRLKLDVTSWGASSFTYAFDLD
jgi:hypothetical protein